MKRLVSLVPFIVAAFTAALPAQQPQQPAQPAPTKPPAATAEDAEKADEGIPVTSPLVRQKCSGCHRADEKGRLTRISYRRTTPEGWETDDQTDGDAERREARAVRCARDSALPRRSSRPCAGGSAARRIRGRAADDRLHLRRRQRHANDLHRLPFVRSGAAAAPHEGRVGAPIAMHRGYYPLSDFQAFRRGGPPPRDQQPGPDGRPPDNRHPMEKAIAHLSKVFPLTTPEWSAWAATMRPPRLAGKWALAGIALGKGAVYGVVTIASQGAGDSGDFTTDTAFTYAAHRQDSGAPRPRNRLYGISVARQVR